MEDVKMYSLSATYTQDSDGMDTNSFGHYLHLELTDPGFEQENYLVIKTDRWALDIDEIDDFCSLLKSFCGVPDGLRKVEN